MKKFKLPKNIRYSEELGLHLSFQELKICGEDKIIYQVLVTEEGTNDRYVHDIYDFKSWENMLKQYPTLLLLSTKEGSD